MSSHCLLIVFLYMSTRPCLCHLLRHHRVLPFYRRESPVSSFSIWSCHLTRHHSVWSFCQRALCATGPYRRGPDFGSLIRERRAGVVAALCAACARVRAAERDAAKNLARGLTSKMAARKEGRSQLAPGLLWMDQHSGAAGGRCSVLGAALLQTVLKFPPDTTPQFVESVASLTAAEAISAACDAGGSRALEAFLGNAAHKPKLKRELIDALSGDWARLAASPCGSHVLEACYGAAEQRTRVGPDRYCSPRHRMPFNSSFEGSKCVR